MKTVIALLLCLSLSGCLIIFPIPIGLIDRAVSGTHCVPATAQVGDIITDVKTGERLRITKISKTEDGSPYFGCGALLPHRVKVESVDQAQTADSQK